MLRSRALRLTAVALALWLAWATIADARNRAAAERDAWGESVDVVVATKAVPPGAAVGEAVVVVPRPRALLPEGALDQLSGDAIAADGLVPGEIVSARRIRDPRRPERVEIALAVAGELPPLTAGDRVDLWAVDPPPAPARLVAERVEVVRTDGALVVAVDRSQVSSIVTFTVHDELAVVRAG